MTPHTAKVVHSTYQFLISYLFELMLLLASKCMSHVYIVCRPLKNYVCHTMNVTSE
ncbi:hypothetical protein F383_04094 [Gossypium arboreum]|uniref:Uncharacterized protein n=1 Tax=Gossypium arboreum TaxID=29729 RepID=A0A0B0Q311_GOSAR|nr:hypothetical protein F383_04094 [Gossypium arboreum]